MDPSNKHLLVSKEPLTLELLYFSSYLIFLLHLHFTVSQIILLLDADWKLDSHGELLSFFFVHAWAMLSTITNPILYGWLNTNLKHLFRAMIPTVKNEKNDNEELTTEHINMNVNGISKESTSIFSRIQKHFWSNGSHANDVQEEQNEMVEMNDIDLTRVSLVNHSPSVESNQTAAQKQNGVENKPKPVMMSVNDHNVNGIEVVEVETVDNKQIPVMSVNDHAVNGIEVVEVETIC